MVLAAICLSAIGVLVKLIGNEVPTMSLNFLRIFIAFLFLLIITLIPQVNPKYKSIPKRKIKKYFLIGVVYAIALSLHTTSNLFTTVQNAVLLHYLYPFFVLPFAYLLLKENITKTKIITLIIAIIGLIIINPISFNSSRFGNLLALLSAIFYAILITEMRAEDKEHHSASIVWFVFFASIVLLPFAIIDGFGNWLVVWPLILILGIFSTGLAYLFYTIALEDIEAESASIITMIITPLISIILAVLIINELIDLQTIIGGIILIIAGIYLETHSKKIKKEEKFKEKVEAVTYDVKHKNKDKLGNDKDKKN